MVLFRCLVVAVVCGRLAAVAAADELRVGVWNIEKLSTTASRGFPELTGSDSLSPRTSAQLRDVAVYIRDELEVDALMVTEIEADSPDSTEARPTSAQLDEIAEQMGNEWRYFLGRTGGKLRLGLLFNTERVRLKKLINLEAEEYLVSGEDVFDRDPLIVWIEAIGSGGQTQSDLLLACLHLKSQQKPFRNNRMAAVAKLIGDLTDKATRAALQLPSQSEEPELLILGDCNDSSFEGTGFHYMFDYLEGTGFKHLRPASGSYPDTRVNGSKIDHIFATRKIVEQTMVANSFRVHTKPPADRDDYRETFSDHFPVTVDLRVSADSDLTLHEALAITDDGRRGAALVALSPELEALAAGPTAAGLEDEEEAKPPRVKYQLIDRDFERILAPVQRSGRGAGGAEPASRIVAAPLATPPPSAPAGRTSAPDPRLWHAVELLHAESDKLLAREGGLGPVEARKLRELRAAEKAVLDLIRNNP